MNITVRYKPFKNYDPYKFPRKSKIRYVPVHCIGALDQGSLFLYKIGKKEFLVNKKNLNWLKNPIDVNYEDYLDYIKSDDWKNRKAKYFKKHPKICKACGSTERIHLHHITYRRLGKEGPRDLVPLCATCHDEVHRVARKKGIGMSTNNWSKKGKFTNLWHITESFIKSKNPADKNYKKHKNRWRQI